MSNELNNIISLTTNGVSEGVAIGGDRYPGTTFLDHLLRYEADPDVKMMVMLGEVSYCFLRVSTAIYSLTRLQVGGIEEYMICDAIKSGRLKKPLVAWCIGTCAAMFSSEVSE